MVTSSAPAPGQKCVLMMSGQDESAAGLEMLPSSTSTAGQDPLTGAVTTPARGPAQRTTSFRPPLRRLSASSSKVHAAFKSPLRTTPTTSTDTTSVSTTLTPTGNSSSGKILTAQQSLKATPPSSGLTGSVRHKPYSLTPARSRSTQSNTVRVTAETEESLRADIARLKEQIRANEAEIEELSREYSEDELQLYIEHLHEYNEIKDTGQLLLGKLAEVQGTTVSELYRQFGLSLDD